LTKALLNPYVAAKEGPLNVEKVNLKEITDAVKTEFSETLEQSKIRWTEPVNPPEIMMDRLSLLRVFRNLADNALKYGGKELVEISIGYEERDPFHILSFSDDGVGIRPQDREKVFGLFQRNETSAGKVGAGLGLAIVKEIAKRHKGQVWIDPTTDKGVTFCMSIPKDLT